MDFINSQHGLDYKYCPDKDAYLSFSGDVLMGSFPRAYVTNPYKMWEDRAIKAGFMGEDGSIDYTDDRVLKLKPTQTVFKIWEHHADFNNQL